MRFVYLSEFPTNPDTTHGPLLGVFSKALRFRRREIGSLPPMDYLSQWLVVMNAWWRLSWSCTSSVTVRFKKAWSNGATNVIYSNLESIEKLVALIPPRANLN